MKRLIAFILSMCLTCGFLTARAEDDLQKKVDYITSLGIMEGYEDNTFRTDSLITRAEFTAVAVRLSGQRESASSGMYDGRFPDVSQDFWAAGYIALALNMGIINGYTDKTFRPENNVTYNEAIKMTVCLLGYGLQAQKLGGYPSGHIAVASKLNLLDFKNYSADAPIDRGEVVRLIYKALDAEVMMTETLGTDGSYVLGKGGTVLDTFLNAETKKGIVTATPLDSIHQKKLTRGYIEIDDTLFKTDIDSAGFLGKKVEYLVVDDEPQKKVVYIKPDASIRSVTIDGDDIIDAEGMFTSSGQLRYWNENKKVQSVHFNAAVNIIYNNKVLRYEDAGSVDFSKAPGVYTCVDNDGDGIYDLLILKAYEDGYVKKVYTDGEKKKAATDKNMLVTDDPGDKDLFVTVIYDGEIVPFSEIKEGDIISAAKSLDGKACEVVISRNVIEGTVSAKSTDDTTVTLTIAENDYNVSKNLINSRQVPSLNDSGKFYLTYRNKIAYFEGSSEADGIYGFLTAVGTKGALHSECSIKILETNNTFSTYPLAKRVKLSDKGTDSTKTAAETAAFFKAEEDSDGDGINDEWFDVRTAKTQIIRYKLNSDGEVNYIATAKETPDENSFSVGAPNRNYFYSNSLCDQKWKTTSGTVVFYIPSTKQGEDYTRYRAGTAASYFSNGNSYQVQLYDINKNGEIGAVFYSLTGQTREIIYNLDYASSPVMVVDKVVYKTGEDGVERCVVSGMENGSYTSVYVSDDFMSLSNNREMLRFGNIIQYQTNAAKVKAAYYDGEPEEIVKAILWCDFAQTHMNKLYNRSTIEQRSPKITTVYGTVKSIDNTKVTVELAGGEETDVFITDTQGTVKIDADEKKLDASTFFDIQPGKKIFVRMRYDRIKDVVIHD